MRLKTGITLTAGLVLCGVPTVGAQPVGQDPPRSRDVAITCEVDLTQADVLGEVGVPANVQTSYWTRAVRKCTESQSQQIQSISCTTTVQGWAAAKNTKISNFACQMVDCACDLIDCDDDDVFVAANKQELKIKPTRVGSAEVTLDCELKRNR